MWVGHCASHYKGNRPNEHSPCLYAAPCRVGGRGADEPINNQMQSDVAMICNHGSTLRTI